MITIEKETNTVDTSHTLDRTKRFINQVEEIFYTAPQDSETLDYVRLNLHSYYYDKQYDKKMRNKQLNLLYLMDEIMFETQQNVINITDTLTQLEDTIFSPEYYRKLIFTFDTDYITETLQLVIISIQKNIDTFNAQITENEYKKLSKQLSFYKPPSNKQKFLKNIKAIATYLEDVNMKLDKI